MPGNETDREAIANLLFRWFSSRRRGSPFFDDIAEVSVPDELASTITSSQPARDRAIHDAEVFLGLPNAVGSGLNIEIAQPFAIVDFESWETSVSPVNVVQHWVSTPDMVGPGSSPDTICRVVFEDGQWKIHTIWDDETREEMIEAIRILERRRKEYGA